MITRIANLLIDKAIERALLKRLVSFDEGTKLSPRLIQHFEKKGLIVVRECADGNYIELTESGRAALEDRS